MRDRLVILVVGVLLGLVLRYFFRGPDEAPNNVPQPTSKQQQEKPQDQQDEDQQDEDQQDEDPADPTTDDSLKT